MNLIVIVLFLLAPFSDEVENRIVEASICSSKSSQLLNPALLAEGRGAGAGLGCCEAAAVGCCSGRGGFCICCTGGCCCGTAEVRWIGGAALPGTAAGAGGWAYGAGGL